MLYLKNCTHCGGDMVDDKDIWGAYKKCLQCGRYDSDNFIPQIIPPKHTYIRQCPKCDAQIRYTRKDLYNKSILKTSMCKKCRPRSNQFIKHKKSAIYGVVV